MLSSLSITILLGTQITGMSNTIWELWLKTFKEYPYLIKSMAQDEYLSSEQCMLLVATVDNKIAGFLIAAPFISTEDSFKGSLHAFENNNLDSSSYYYISDVVVVPEFRGNGIASQLLRMASDKAQEWGYTNLCLVTIEREKNHPLKPDNYVNPDTVWKQLGFSKTVIKIKKKWSTIIDNKGNAEDRDNILVFWIKEL